MQVGNCGSPGWISKVSRRWGPEKRQKLSVAAGNKKHSSSFILNTPSESAYVWGGGNKEND